MRRSRKIKLPENLIALVRNLHPQLKRKIRSALDSILEDPGCGKSLHDELAGYRSVRIGRIRVIYRAAGSVIEVVAIGPRDSIYLETALLLRRSAGAPGGDLED